MSIDLILGVVSFCGIVILLVLVIIAARSRLVSTGNVSIEINGDSDNPIVVPAGSKLLQTLADNNIFLASACGGGGGGRPDTAQAGGKDPNKIPEAVKIAKKFAMEHSS